MSGNSAGAPSAREAIAAVSSGFDEIDAATHPGDPLSWPGYDRQIARAEERSGERESVVTGTATVGGTEAVVIAFDFRFLGGSMGQATGGRIVRALQLAREKQIPVVSLIASGGARMQEGMRSLVQMQRIAAESAANREAGIFHVSVLRDPTTGGVWASFASTADVIIAIEGATVCFAGPRVRANGDGSEAFTAEGKRAAGFVDAVVPADAVPAALGAYLDVLHPRGAATPCPPPPALGGAPAGADAWSTVLAARDPALPRAAAYLDAYFDRYAAISGDRCGGVDEGMLCGIGRRGSRVIAYAAQTGTANSPAGFRTAARLLRLAERLRLPVLTLVDTPGAANDAEAERGGVGTSIAELFVEVASLTVPVTTLVVGEGGSGGALALAAPDRVWMVEASYFGVIAPEGAAAILYRDRERAEEIASMMHLTPIELARLGFARGTV
jgi:acetyl-CoA carboxylase beta subunit